MITLFACAMLLFAGCAAQLQRKWKSRVAEFRTGVASSVDISRSQTGGTVLLSVAGNVHEVSNPSLPMSEQMIKDSVENAADRTSADAHKAHATTTEHIPHLHLQHSDLPAAAIHTNSSNKPAVELRKAQQGAHTAHMGRRREGGRRRPPQIRGHDSRVLSSEQDEE